MVMLSKNADMGQAAGRSALPDELLPGPSRQTVGEVQNLKIASLQFFFTKRGLRVQRHGPGMRHPKDRIYRYTCHNMANIILLYHFSLQIAIIRTLCKMMFCRGISHRWHDKSTMGYKMKNKSRQ